MFHVVRRKFNLSGRLKQKTQFPVKLRKVCANNQKVNTAYISIGSNLGDRAANMLMAINEIINGRRGITPATALRLRTASQWPDNPGVDLS